MAKAKLSIKPADAIVGIAILVVAGLTYFIARSQASALVVKHQDLQQKQTQLAQLENKRTELTSIANELDTYQADADLLKIAYPVDDQSIEALIQTEAMAQRAGVATSGLTPNKAEPGKLVINLSTESSYSAFIKLLEEFQNNLRPVLISSLSLSAGAESKADTVVGTIVANFAYGGAAAGTPSVPLPPNPTGSDSGSTPAAAPSPAK